MPEKLKIMTVMGTRPEAVKMAPVIKALEASPDFESVVCVTAQHRSMLDQVLNLFQIQPKHDLDIMKPNQTISDVTTAVLLGIQGVIAVEKPDMVLVHGDTATTFSAALAAFYAQTSVGHVEAGLRSFDKYQPYPEEMNRVLTTRLSDAHFAPTALSKSNLLKENVPEQSIFVTGNTAVDSLSATVSPDYRFHEDALKRVDFAANRVIAMTAHRRENLGRPLQNICEAALSVVNANPDVWLVYAVHKNPAVRDTVFSVLSGHPRVLLTDPLDMDDMHNLIARCYFVLTDSGGIQEEAPGLHKPVLVLRNVTERPEGLEAGTLRLCGTDKAVIAAECGALLNDKARYAAMASAKNPYGDGRAAQRIVAALLYHFGLSDTRPKDY